ncbi:MAG: universal stress protein [Solirubrobacteraceae bacterium]|jgi:nucleotide-binding universal stress UspA family protein
MSVASTNCSPVLWDRVVCAVDGTVASLNAARQVAALMPSAAQLMLCVVVARARAQTRGMSKQGLVSEAEEALARVRGEIATVHDAGVHLREGAPARVLLHECSAERATLVAIGSQGGSNGGSAIISVSAAVLKGALCSVLIAHETDRAGAPGEGGIVVGFDGSEGAISALSAGYELSERLSRPLRAVFATGDGDRLDPGSSDQGVASQVTLSEDRRTALEALLDASDSADLLILGSRQHRGAPVLSRVSQSVTERASCPVLLVR